jgi:hypothetical protein
LADFSKGIHAQLENHPLMGRVQLQECQRKTDLVVEIASAAKRAVPLAKDGSSKFLARRLAKAAGDAYDSHVVPPAPERGRCLEGLQAARDDKADGRGHLEAGRDTAARVDYRAGKGQGHLFCDYCNGTGSQSLRNEFVSVVVLAA